MRGNDIPVRNMNSDDRFDQLTRWVRSLDGLGEAVPVPASADASFRRYYRVTGRQNYIVMDSPTGREDSQRFIRVAGYLESMSLNCPAILETDLDQGFLLVTDLGDRQYLQALNDSPESAEHLYRDAIDSLVRLQERGAAYQGELPLYDEILLRFELSLFRDWLCDTHLGLGFSAGDESAWQACCDLLVENALEQPRVFVHRDFHSRNLMVCAADNPGILDFQDALEGPYTYDLVSLMKDCYVRFPDEFVARHVTRFLERRAFEVSAEEYRRQFDLMGAQRHLKACGIFARLNHRDGRPDYLGDIPRTLGYVIDVSAKHDELAFLASLIKQRVLPRLSDEAS